MSPSAPQRLCPFCDSYFRGRCECRKVDDKARDKWRGSRSERGYGRRWKRARLRWLACNPLCVEHLRSGETVVASVVDHIQPHKGDWRLFWDQQNWQSLCKSCHDRKTAKELWRAKRGERP